MFRSGFARRDLNQKKITTAAAARLLLRSDTSLTTKEYPVVAQQNQTGNALANTSTHRDNTSLKAETNSGFSSPQSNEYRDNNIQQTVHSDGERSARSLEEDGTTNSTHKLEDTEERICDSESDELNSSSNQEVEDGVSDEDGTYSRRYSLVETGSEDSACISDTSEKLSIEQTSSKNNTQAFDDNASSLSFEFTSAPFIKRIQLTVFNKITISDDRTGTRDLEQRKLLALRQNNSAPQPTRTDPQFEEWFPVVEPSKRNKPNYVAKDAQMQLMLLEQQLNKKRLLMGHQEQDSLRPMDPSATMADPSDPPSINFSTDAFGQSSSNPTEIQSLQSNSEISRDKDLGILEMLNTDIDTHLDVQKLQDYIQLLQAKAEEVELLQKKMSPSRYQILNRIWRPKSMSKKTDLKDCIRSGPFFDPPDWILSDVADRNIRCSAPIVNFDLYIERNKDISFIVYRDFDPRSDNIILSEAEGQHLGDSRPPPQATQETIQPIAANLVVALNAVLNSQQEYSEIQREFETTGELSAPYFFIYHSRGNLDSIKAELSVPAQEQLTLFVDYVLEKHQVQYCAADSLMSQNRISPQYIQYLFKPGEVVILKSGDSHRGCMATSWPQLLGAEMVTRSRVKNPINQGSLYYHSRNGLPELSSGQVKTQSWDIKAWYWDFDGNFHRVEETLRLEMIIEDTLEAEDKSRQGKKQEHALKELASAKDESVLISELNVYPARFASDYLIQQLRKRGNIFWQCRERKYVQYKEDKVGAMHSLSEERYMIDLDTYNSLHGDKKKSNDELGPELLAMDTPPDEHFELMVPLKIKGYNLRLKKWFELIADRISDVQWKTEAFKTLVIDPKSKDLILALVSNQIAAEKSTDVISGKGNGLILLLHGGPGTGKTLTAESVAEIAQKPLYRVTCGDVGTKAEEVEKYMESVLHLGKIWSCVVLLDEADVFLEQRSLEDLERNALVSVFLRVLEYYEGILILTSNRVGTFDEAFKSRIQLALHYPSLGPYQRLRIWEIFINRLESFEDNTMDIADLRNNLEQLQKEEMNGRQIRNAITTARQYAEYKKQVLKYAHLKDVIEVSLRFERSLNQLNQGFTQDQIMQDEGIRV